MPHGIFLHAAPKNSNNYSLLYRASTSSTPSRNILRCNHPLVLFSNFCASTKSIRCNSYLLRTTAFLLLGKPPENSGTDYYAGNQLLPRNHINNTQRTSPKVLVWRSATCHLIAPHYIQATLAPNFIISSFNLN